MSNHQLECLELLLESGADSARQDQNGGTAAHYAAAENNVDALTMLSHADSPLNLLDKDGDTPLHIAVRQAHQDSVFALLDSGALTNIQNLAGDMPLHEACRLGQVAVVQRLIEQGSDIEIKSFTTGLTPVGEARIHGHKQVLDIIFAFYEPNPDYRQPEDLGPGSNDWHVKPVDPVDWFGMPLDSQNDSGSRDANNLEIKEIRNISLPVPMNDSWDGLMLQSKVVSLFNKWILMRDQQSGHIFFVDRQVEFINIIFSS